MNPEAFDLTLEQQLQLRIAQQAVTTATHDQLGEMLIEVTRLLMIKDNVIKDLLRSQIGCPNHDP